MDTQKQNPEKKQGEFASGGEQQEKQEAQETPQTSPVIDSNQGQKQKDDNQKIIEMAQKLKKQDADNSESNNSDSEKIQRDDTYYIKKAKEIIAKDKGDPYQEEEDHESLQIEYLKDKFNKEIGKS